ncbi:MAG TPA: hypothetical protein VFG10_15480 [Saprospiraceae bacterium]|nr:hypothetical protein [Saprospiraceae bacterium]
MKSFLTLIIFTLAVFTSHNSFGQIEEQKAVDIVWLKDGSKLTGTILKWDLEVGMNFKLLTGAEIVILKKDIHRVMQDVQLGDRTGVPNSKYSFVRTIKPYSFKEKGWYQNSSGFINISFYSGAGIHHAMGYRFSRMLGIGLGVGIESNDFTTTRNIVPIYAEARGFLLPQKISPYYALKLGYGFALKDESRFITDAVGGIYVSPEIGVRFGGGEVSYYLGVEYKLQNATFTSDGFDFGGAKVTDKISYRRIELRTGLLF